MTDIDKAKIGLIGVIICLFIALFFQLIADVARIVREEAESEQVSADMTFVCSEDVTCSGYYVNTEKSLEVFYVCSDQVKVALRPEQSICRWRGDHNPLQGVEYERVDP